MERPSFASDKEIQKQILAADLETLLAKLEGYAYSLLSKSSIKTEPIDLVMDVLLKVQTLERKWDKDKCPDFGRFLFISVRSHFLNELKKNKNRLEAEEGHNYSFLINTKNNLLDQELDYDLIREKLFKELSKLDPSIEEESIFECWIDGVHEPRTIAKFLEIPVGSVYNATRRLNRKLPIIKEQIKPYFDGR